MTKTERTVQVPVSLIERTLKLRGMNYEPAQEVLRELRALLSEPIQPSSQSIADMAPGTTFVAVKAHSASSASHEFVVLNDGRVRDTHTWLIYPEHRIDPSTIRDVTSPKS